MIADEKTIKMIKNAYIHESPNPYVWPESISLKDCFCWAVSFCSVLVILSCVFAGIM